MTGKGRSLLVVAQHSPYGSGLGKVALDVALAAAAFEQDVKILFLGDGVLQLVPEQDGHAIGSKNMGRLLASFPLYGIEQVYAAADTLERYGLDPAQSPVSVVELNSAQIHALISRHDHVVSL